MTMPVFRDRTHAERWLAERAAVIGALEALGTREEIEAAKYEYSLVLAWLNAGQDAPSPRPWYVELALAGAVTLVLIGILWLAGEIR
jgi:hypothetical protein